MSESSLPGDKVHKDLRGTDLNLYPFDLTSGLLSTIFLVASSLTGEDMIEPPQSASE